MLCPECNRFFTCRRCHDAVSTHILDRYSVQAMACMYCLRIQVITLYPCFHFRSQLKSASIVIKY